MQLLIIALLLSAAPGLFSGSTAWYASHASLILTQALAAVLIFRLTDRHPAALLWLILCVWDVLLFPVWLTAPVIHSAINWVVWPLAIGTALYHLRHRHITVNPRHTYIAVSRCHTFQGFLLALCGVPGGSCKIITGGAMYGYYRGRLQRKAVKNVENYVIIRLSRKTVRHMPTGERWTWRLNCLTLILRVKLWTR